MEQERITKVARFSVREAHDHNMKHAQDDESILRSMSLW